MKYRSFDYPGSGGTAGGYDSIYCRTNRLKSCSRAAGYPVRYRTEFLYSDIYLFLKHGYGSQNGILLPDGCGIKTE